MCRVLEPNLSDHAGVFAVFFNWGVGLMDKSTIKNAFVLKRVLSASSVLKFKEILSQFNWSQLKQYNNVDQAFEHFLFVLTTSLEECCKIRKIKNNKSKRSKITWFTPELKNIRDFIVTLYDR